MIGVMHPSHDEHQGPAGDLAADTHAADNHADVDQPREGVVVSQDGMGVAVPSGSDQEAGKRVDPNASADPAGLVGQPGKVMRIASMIKQLLEEVRSAPLDEAGRSRLAEIHRRSISELEQGLAPELIDELERITLPFSDDAPSDAELRIAQAQLVGWLEGLFHGIQAALFAQQMVAQQQLETMRRALPPGAAGQESGPGQHPSPGMPTSPTSREGGPTGQYL